MGGPAGTRGCPAQGRRGPLRAPGVLRSARSMICRAPRRRSSANVSQSESVCLSATPRHATPSHATPRHATPRYRHATPPHATPRHATPRNATPRHATLCSARLVRSRRRSRGCKRWSTTSRRRSVRYIPPDWLGAASVLTVPPTQYVCMLCYVMYVCMYVCILDR